MRKLKHCCKITVSQVRETFFLNKIGSFFKNQSLSAKTKLSLYQNNNNKKDKKSHRFDTGIIL